LTPRGESDLGNKLSRSRRLAIIREFAYEKGFYAQPPFSGVLPNSAELQLAVRIIGIHATVFPEKGNFPFRDDIQASPPKIINKLAKDNTALLTTQAESDIVVPPIYIV
jgi:hypothetical protein